MAVHKRAIKFVSDYNFFTIRGGDGKENNHMQEEILSATMSQDTQKKMETLLQRAKNTPNEFVEYPNG